MQQNPKIIEIKPRWRGISKGKAKRYYAIFEDGDLIATSSNDNKVKGFIDACKHRQIKVIGDIDY